MAYLMSRIVAVSRVAAAIGLAAPACAIAQITAPPRQICYKAPLPRRLPAIASIVDSATLVGMLREDLPAAGSATLEVSFAGTGALEGIRVLRSTYTGGESRKLMQSVGALVEPQTAGPAWSGVLTVTVSNAVGLKLERSEYCLPRMRVQGANDLSRMFDSERQVMRGTNWTEVTIDSSGAILAIRIIKQAPTQNLDSLAVRYLGGMLYDAARQNGTPVTAVDTVEFVASETVYRGGRISARSIRREP